MARAYTAIRKDYINARQDTLLLEARGRINRRDAKELACREFDELIHQEREAAVAKALAGR
ncbi:MULTISPECIES: hypothetical protein [unclassified Microbacterium]|uniref:hypothetical protein n=1 Tax=unclassified Microbacterium TaxID=2609290 RepID=UPI002883070C|nr:MULTISPECIES: hypothetical protein [unclassified Microbacterium]